MIKFEFSIYSTEFKDEKYLDVIGQRKKLSDKDILKLNAMYDCDGASTD